MSAQGKDLLAAALSMIEMHPETWNQRTWECGTAACLAGHMARLDPDVVATYVLPKGWPESGVVLQDREWWSYYGYVCRQLNINIDEAISLTDPKNSLDDLRAGVKAVLNGESVEDAIKRDRAERAS